MKRRKQRRIEISGEAISFYGLTIRDLTDKAKLDEACIRLEADLALAKLIKKRGN